ncbi:MAG: DUF2490 domain-containing protein [Chitinophagaceae bacterium]|nr:DUF2490 domain-containing protein [Chitinophagaceae bacterium]
MSFSTRLLVVSVLLNSSLLSPAAKAQKQITEDAQTWLGYFNQSRLSNKWGLWTDLHFRTKQNLVENPGIFIARAGATWYLNDKTKLTAGYAFINHFPADNHKNISQPEHRPWQQIQWHQNSSRFKLMQWVRLEQRFRRNILNDNALADGYNFNWRVRYNIMLQFPLGRRPFEPGSLALALNNESMLNFGKRIVNNTFDQNRAFAGFHYYVNKHDWLQVGYMNFFQQTASPGQYRMFHTARVFFFHNIDWRRQPG